MEKSILQKCNMNQSIMTVLYNNFANEKHLLDLLLKTFSAQSPASILVRMSSLVVMASMLTSGLQASFNLSVEMSSKVGEFSIS